MQLQTTETDIRAGWRYFRAWKHRFWMSTRVFVPRISSDLIYLASFSQIQTLDDDDEGDVHFATARDQKIAFMEAFLSVVALDSHNFEAYVRTLLKLQSRISARHALGFWFRQSDYWESDNGGGVSPFFQGEQISVFCENPKQIDFSDISSILPYDEMIVRHPTAEWSANEATKVVDHIKWDLAFDGTETEIEFNLAWDLLHINLSLPTTD